MNNKRNLQIDVVKVLALFLVITVHFFLYTGYYNLNNFSYWGGEFFDDSSFCLY